MVALTKHSRFVSFSCNRIELGEFSSLGGKLCSTGSLGNQVFSFFSVFQPAGRGKRKSA